MKASEGLPGPSGIEVKLEYVEATDAPARLRQAFELIMRAAARSETEGKQSLNSNSYEEKGSCMSGSPEDGAGA